MPRIWTPEQRERLARLIREARPWTRSTGPRTMAGKVIAARNSYKHGLYSAAVRAFFTLMRNHSAWLKEVRMLHKRNELVAKSLVRLNLRADSSPRVSARC